MKKFFYYLKIWWMMSRNAFLAVLSQKSVFLIFLIGKILRFGMFFGFIYFLIKGTNNLAGYNLNQTLFFFLTFNFIDIVSQFLFREVYRFRGEVVSGSFDLVLTKPVSALFRSLMGGADVIDLATIPPLIFTIYFVGAKLQPSFLNIAFYLLLLANGLLVATAFHIFVLGFGIITLEVDHMIMVYRDFVALGRFPIDIYKEPLKGMLTYFVPVAVMLTIPAKALMGLASPKGIILSFILGTISIFLALKFWRFALKYYTSASS